MTYVGQSASAVEQPESGAGSGAATLKDVVLAYVGLTKPRVIELLLLTTVPVMFFAAKGVPGLALVVATVVGGTFSAGSASVFNCVYDRDIDEQMRRTRRRALPRHIVSPRAALVFGFVLGGLSTVVLAVWVNPLSAGLAVLANAFYVFGYTMLLKRRTTQNIVWGGLAGCFPALIGWTAVTNELSWVPVVLFAVVFFWTPPHTWALALRFREDYANVDVPLLPVVASAREVGRQIVLYSWVMVATS
ncbi:heme o synthase, partial [Nocardioides sp.]|uniref:heme o synthase n=1 Tax=Nocardioides sp. TaxID=35761 RepID=UPI0031FF1EF1|nr:protoheme farnesyltransferase [Nocardioides sp.]